MIALLRKHWPLFCALIVYWLTLTVLVILSTNLNQGHLIYPLDDTYIHMSIAKNLVLHHVWGVTRYEFTSSTSSPLWTLLVALTYLIFGVNEISPLILNVIFGSLVILFSYLFLTKYIKNRLGTMIILLVAIFVTPLPSLTLVGMEHVLHALLTLCFVYFSIMTLSAKVKPIQKYDVQLLVIAPFVTTIRYEGIFLVFVVCVLLLLQRRVFSAIILGITALLPVIVYGVWSMAHGWYFLPNSVILKGHIPVYDLIDMPKLLGFRALTSILANKHILILACASLLLLVIQYWKGVKSNAEIKYALMIFIGSLLLHMQFASTAWFYRYEAYLVLLGAIVISIAVNDLLPEKRALEINKKSLPYFVGAILLLIFVTNPFLDRATNSLMITPQATNNIYEQQYQMGTFFKRFYQGKTIAANDIGAVTYLADIQIVDLWGLGSLEPARLKLQEQYTTQKIYYLTRQRGVTIAIVYDLWFKRFGGLPGTWINVGQWGISNNVIAASDIVSLYAVNPSASDDLMQNLKHFAKELPIDVQQYGKYIEK